MTERTEIQKPPIGNPQTSSAPGSRKRPFPILESGGFLSQQLGPIPLSEKQTGRHGEFLSLGIKGTEFHPSMTASDKEQSLAHCCHALYDLAQVLSIDPKDISLGGNLSLSFGAHKHRGPGAVYEPEQQKILITGENPDGFLAHAWAHALDHHICQMCKTAPFSSETFASDHPNRENLPESVRNLFHALQFKMTTITSQEQNRVLDTERLRSIRSATKALENQVRALTPGHSHPGTEEPLG